MSTKPSQCPQCKRFVSTLVLGPRSCAGCGWQEDLLTPPPADEEPAPAPGDLGSGQGLVRTDMHCTECGKNFIARIDFGINGNHVVECPWCGHEHYRMITAGVMTEQRWSSSSGGRVKVDRRNVWKATELQIKTSSAAEFMRDLWLNRIQEGGP